MPWRFMITGTPSRKRSPKSLASLNRIGSARWIAASGGFVDGMVRTMAGGGSTTSTSVLRLYLRTGLVS